MITVTRQFVIPPSHQDVYWALSRGPKQGMSRAEVSAALPQWNPKTVEGGLLNLRKAGLVKCSEGPRRGRRFVSVQDGRMGTHGD